MLRISGAFKVLVVAVLAFGLVGCASSKMKQENAELKKQAVQMSEALAAAESDATNLRDQNASLQAELEKTRSDYAAKTAELESLSDKLKAQGFDVSVRDGMVVVTMSTKVLYGSGSAAISSSGRSKLAQLATALNSDFKGYSIEVQGHTDTDPINRTKDKYKSNWELSYERAQNVAYYLIESGKVDPKRLHVAAFSQYKPVSSNSSSEGKAKNRRVEILVIRPAGE